MSGTSAKFTCPPDGAFVNLNLGYFGNKANFGNIKGSEGKLRQLTGTWIGTL